MVTIRIPATITADREIIAHFPDDVDIPVGDLEVLLEVATPISAPEMIMDDRERTRALLAAGGVLSTAWDELDEDEFDTPDNDDEDDEELIDIPRGLVDRYLDEDRGPRD